MIHSILSFLLLVHDRKEPNDDADMRSTSRPMDPQSNFMIFSQSINLNTGLS